MKNLNLKHTWPKQLPTSSGKYATNENLTERDLNAIIKQHTREQKSCNFPAKQINNT